MPRVRTEFRGGPYRVFGYRSLVLSSRSLHNGVARTTLHGFRVVLLVNRSPNRMASARTKKIEHKTEAEQYTHETPIWSKYHNRVRASVRFPRYYKRALNW
jgi:hypothetical protein